MASPSRFSFGNVLKLAIPAALVVGGFYFWTKYQEEMGVPRIDYVRTIAEGQKRIAESHKPKTPLPDADDDMVPDAPSDPAKLADPETLAFAPLPTADPDAVWKEFRDHLAKITGKKVVQQAVEGSDELRERLREGSLHILGVNTGLVPTAVASGFVPAFVMAGTDGTYGYAMKVIVRADSPVKTLADLKGRKVTMTTPSSHSGYKAPLTILRDEAKLTPGTDYELPTSGSHDTSIKKLAEKQYEVVCVAGDLLKRAEARGDIAAKDYRVIYESKKFPPGCYGYAYNLKPDLAKKVREAFLTFDWKGSGLEKSFGPAGAAKFVAAKYKDDWAYVREIDEKLLAWK